MYQLSARALSAHFKKGELSATQIARYFLARIEKHEPQVGAFLSVLSQRVLAKAAALDAKRASGEPLGALAAVPIAVKDNIHIRGERTTCGSRFLRDYKAVFDATVVRLMEKEDALILGKTNMDEFAMGSSTENSAYHKSKNPWDLSCVPGGSSGGSASAVAARFCPLALGSDTGGSIRQPAAFTGVIGFKPTYGRVSRYGLVAFASSLDQIGPLAWNMEDAHLLMQVLSRQCPHDSTSRLSPPLSPLSNKVPHGLRIGVPWNFLEELHNGSKAAFKASLELLQAQGAVLIDIDLDLLKYSVAIYYILATAEASTNLARFDGIRYGARSPQATTIDQVYEFSKQEGFGPEVKHRILLGTYVLSAGYQDAYYKKAQKVRRLFIDKYNEAFRKCDVIATPTSPFAAFRLNAIHDPLQMYLQDIYTIGANLAGLPAVSVPSGFTPEERPLGIQFIGPFLHDDKVLSIAHALETLSPLSHKIPPLFDHD